MFVDHGVWLTAGYEWCADNKGKKKKKLSQVCHRMFNGDGIVGVLK